MAPSNLAEAGQVNAFCALARKKSDLAHFTPRHRAAKSQEGEQGVLAAQSYGKMKGSLQEIDERFAEACRQAEVFAESDLRPEFEKAAKVGFTDCRLLYEEGSGGVWEKSVSHLESLAEIRAEADRRLRAEAISARRILGKKAGALLREQKRFFAQAPAEKFAALDAYINGWQRALERVQEVSRRERRRLGYFCERRKPGRLLPAPAASASGDTEIRLPLAAPAKPTTKSK